MEIEGTLIYKSEVKTVTDKFRKRDIVIKTHEEYPQEIMLQLVQDKCELVSNVGVGTNIAVSFNLRGKSFINKEGNKGWFNQLDVWKLNVKA